MFAFLSFVILIILFIAGIPVVFSIALVSLSYFLINGISLTTFAQRTIAGTDSFALMAAPLFMLAGLLMTSGGSVKRLVTLAEAAVGHLRGGLGHVNVIASMIFAGMSGSATADVAGLGVVEMKIMNDAGYDKKFSAAVTAASSTIGPIVPPSVPFVVYGALGQVSVGRLFLGGAIPGFLMGFYLMATVYLIAKKRNFHRGKHFSLKTLLSAFKGSIFELFTPIIIVGGIITGIFTPTEAAVVAIAYAFVLEVIVRREIPFKKIPRILLEGAKLSGVVMFIVATAQCYNWILMREKVGEMVLTKLITFTQNPAVIIIFVLLAIIILGCFVEPIACIILIVPVMQPLAKYIGFDPVFLGVFVVIGIMVGNITPPVGVSMFLICSIAEIEMMDFVKAVSPFFIALVLLLITVAYIPSLTLFLPNLLMGR